MPPPKELHYFDYRFNEPSFGVPLARLFAKQERADNCYPWVWCYQVKIHLQGHREKFDLRNALWDFRFFARSPSDRWYSSLFEQARARIVGEITPKYSSLDEEVVAYIHGLMPNARILALMRNPLMRNPIERVYSG